jgi:uncharacterized protein (TIGR02246 family)
MMLRPLLALWFAGSLLLAQEGGAQKEETAIRKLVQQYVEAREANDGKQIEQCFTSDADQLVSSGEWRRGREEVVSGTMRSFANEKGHRTITVENVRFLSPDVAIADGRYELTGQAGNSTRKMWTTLVCKRESAGWRIAAIRNMLPAPPAGSK